MIDAMARVATGESSLERAVRILDSFTPDNPILTVGEIARRSELPIATASRLVAELVRHGLLARGTGRDVRIGMRMWELAERASPTLTLRKAATPFLGDLQAVVGHHSQLCVLDNDQVLCLERLSRPDAVINYSRIAGRLPFHATAAGLVMLAYASPDLQQRVLGRPLQRFTDRTFVHPERVRAELESIMRMGFCVLAGHLHEDAAGIAVPVRNGLGEVVAALAAVVPNDGRAHAHAPALLAAARGLSRLIPPISR